MADYQCPACLEIMDSSPKYAPFALKCGHIMCGTCLPKTLKRLNHVCGICRKECGPEDVHRVYLPALVRSPALAPPSPSTSSRTSSPPLSEPQIRQAHDIADAASLAGVESSHTDLQNIVTSAERWYVGLGENSKHFQDTLDALLAVLTDLRRKLVYAARLDSAKQLQNRLQLEIDMHKSELASYEQRFRENELNLAQTKHELTQWEKHVKRSEAIAAQWEQQANLIEDRRYTESIRAEGAISILRSQISVLQKEVQEQTRRKLSYKKKYYATKQTTRSIKNHRRYHPASDDDSLEISSPTSTADEAEISNAFSVPQPSQDKPESPSGDALVQTDATKGQESDDDLTIIYGPPPSQPHQPKKRKLSNVSISSTSSTLSILPLTPEEQDAREAALDARLSKRLQAARQAGVKEGWVPPDWKGRIVMADRIKEMKRAKKRKIDELEKGVSTHGTVGGVPTASTRPAQSSARAVRRKET